MRKALLSLNITIENDTTLEKNEDFNFTLQARDPMNRIQIVNESVAFTILNDDGEVILTIANVYKKGGPRELQSLTLRK